MNCTLHKMLYVEFEFYSPNANPEITASKLYTEILFELVYSLRSEVHHIHVIALDVKLGDPCGFPYLKMMVYCYTSGVV